MEIKSSLTSSTYKKLSKDSPWKKTFIAEKPWKEMAVDVDSLVFFHMRKYLDIPYSTRRDETMICAAFISSTAKSTQLVIEDMARYSVVQTNILLKFLKSNGIKTYPVYSAEYPKLKQELREERIQKRKNIAERMRGNVFENKYQIQTMIKKYMLYFRDEVRDIVVSSFTFYKSKEADKYCGKTHRVVISEDVDIFLFGNDRTTIVRPFLVSSTYLDFLDCKSYYKDKGISTHEDFIQVCFMIGTDYNYGIKGMGTKKSVEAIVRYGTIAKYLAIKYDLTDENVAILKDRYGKFVRYISF